MTLCFVCAVCAQGAISYGSAWVVAHPSVPATQAEEELPTRAGPSSSSGLPPHPTCNSTSMSPKREMMVQEAPQRVRPSLGKGERSTEQTDLLKTKNNQPTAQKTQPTNQKGVGT